MVHLWYIQPHIDAINNRSRELALVALELGGGAGALFAGGSGVAARAGIHGRDQYNMGGKVDRSSGT